jgi:glyoxylase-like metal-dependent hydrolase (beta-lactamase superfamily II)/rhodanese-related sulfurtransferase
MYFHQFLDQLHGCASYLVASRRSSEAAIIDPALDLDQYEAVMRLRGFRLRYVIDTHIHADHVSGARELSSRHGAQLCLHELAGVNYPFSSLQDGQELELGQLRLRIWHTPGHRPELVSILVVNPQRSPEPAMALTGDALLAGEVGRPDFSGGDAEAQYESIQRLLTLPDWVAIFPGHFEGPCGRHMSGQPSTTVGFERHHTPLVQCDRATFVTDLTCDIPARPLNMAAIEATNRGFANMPWAMPNVALDVPHVNVGALRRLPPDALVVDVREPDEYGHGHVPKAVNIPQAELATRLDELPHDRPLLLICRTGARSLRAAQFLRQVGFDQVVTVDGGIRAWLKAGASIRQAQSASAMRL